MAGGLYLTNTSLYMPVFVVPPEWCAVSMAHSNRCWRAVPILRKVSSRSFPACHLISSGFWLVSVMAVIRDNKITPYVHLTLSFGC